MKKISIAIVLISSLFSCKKETTNTTNSNTTNNPNSVSCGDNPNINFSAVGTQIGKFSDCIKDVDGNTYKTVTIGTQTWMAENLKTSKYNDGTQIPNLTDNTKWQNDTLGAWSYYNNDSLNNSKFGKLYNWYAVNKSSNGNKNICPTGWHVPTYAEWTVLIDYLGGENVTGGKMKEVGTTSWNSPNTDATNTSLFTGLPGGCRLNVGYYYHIGYDGYWWSSSNAYTYYAWYRNLNYNLGGAYRTTNNEHSGLSVRCLRD